MKCNKNVIIRNKDNNIVNIVCNEDFQAVDGVYHEISSDILSYKTDAVLKKMSRNMIHDFAVEKYDYKLLMFKYRVPVSICKDIIQRSKKGNKEEEKFYPNKFYRFSEHRASGNNKTFVKGKDLEDMSSFSVKEYNKEAKRLRDQVEKAFNIGNLPVKYSAPRSVKNKKELTKYRMGLYNTRVFYESAFKPMMDMDGYEDLTSTEKGRLNQFLAAESSSCRTYGRVSMYIIDDKQLVVDFVERMKKRRKK